VATSKIQTGLRLDETVFQKLKHIADLEGRSFNNLTEQIIRLYLRAYEAEHGEIELPRD
jgi:hypothetical protein